MASEDSSETQGSDAHETVVEAESTAQYEPVVQLEKVEVDSGEKNEDVLYKQRCILYRFAAEAEPPQWKERGKGDVKLLKHKDTGMVRILLRQEKTLKLCCNHVVHPLIDLKANPGSDRFWTWRTEDFADPSNPQTETFGIKFKSAEIAQEFKKDWDAARKINDGNVAKKTGSTPTKAAPATATTASPAAAKPAAAEQKDDDSLWLSIIKERKFAPLKEDDIKALWKAFDKDGSNTIDATELKALMHSLLKAILKTLQVPASAEVSAKVEAELPGVVAAALASLDKNKDGKVSWSEFLQLNQVKMMC
jgi:Ran-binding protein 1